MPRGFAGPAAEFVECRPRAPGLAAFRPSVFNPVYSDAAPAVRAEAAINASKPAVLCDADGELARQLRGGRAIYAVMAVFGSPTCTGQPTETFLVNGQCGPARGGDTRYRRESLRCSVAPQAPHVCGCAVPCLRRR